MTDEYNFAIDVPLRNEWSNVGLIVTSVQNCFNAMFANVRGSKTVAMVTGELLENAIKYGKWNSSDERLRLRVSGSSEIARITVENPATEEDFRELQKNLDWMAGYPNAEAAFRARLLALATTTDPDVSRLGIVRIAYEAKCNVKASFTDGIVRLTGELTL